MIRTYFSLLLSVIVFFSFYIIIFFIFIFLPALERFFGNIFPNEVYCVECALDLKELDQITMERKHVRDKLEKVYIYIYSMLIPSICDIMIDLLPPLIYTVLPPYLSSTYPTLSLPLPLPSTHSYF